MDDRISSLPDEIIYHIGSFLSAKEAAFAMVLSKRWRNLFTIIPELQLHRWLGFDDSLDNGGLFLDFLDGVLALPVTTRIRNFSLRWCFMYNEPAQYDHIFRCLSHVLKLGVMDLELQVAAKKRGGYSLPLEVFTCKTVEKLKLGYGFVIDFLPADTFLPSLKTLFLDSIQFYEFGRCAFNTLISAAPVLEELVIEGIDWERWKWSFTVSSPTLQRLTMRRTEWDCYFGEYFDVNSICLDSRGLAHDFDSLVLDTPALTYLEYADYVPKKYPIVNLNSLVEAKLDLRADYYYQVWEKRHADDFDPMKLINGLKHVEILDLNNNTMEMIYLFDEAIPVFENLLLVTVKITFLCWNSLTILVKKCPKLKTLIIENWYRGLDRSVCECVKENSVLSSCPLEVLKITPYNGSPEELIQMKHILGKLSCLELVDIHSRVRDEIEMKRIEADLLMLPRVSSKCKIQIKFS